jgi:predicted MFS family arabinose efflux permease
MRSILKTPQVGRLFVFSITARLPLAMLSIGLVVHIQRLTGSFAAAGLTTAAYAVCEGLGGPVLGRLVDRGAQTLVLLASAAVCAALLFVIAIVPAATPRLLLIALAGGIGLTTPPVAACLRSQLPALLPDGDRLQAGYALETSLAELTWVAGPPLMLGVGALWSTGAALASFGLVLLLATGGFAMQPASRAWRPEPVGERRRGGSLRSPAMRTLTLTLLCFGVLLGADEVAVTVSAKALEGSTAAAAPLFALWGAGSLLGGLIVTKLGGGARSALGLILWLTALTVGHLLLIGAASSAITLAAALLIAGATIAPTEASVYGMVEGIAPKGTVTEAFAWLATAIAVGSALGAAGAGALADQGGPTAAYLLGAGAGALAALIALARAATATATATASASATATATATASADFEAGGHDLLDVLPGPLAALDDRLGVGERDAQLVRSGLQPSQPQLEGCR